MTEAEKAFEAGQFQGRVEEGLKNIKDDILELKSTYTTGQERVWKELKALRQKVDHNRLKIAGIVASVSLIVTCLSFLIHELLKK